MPLEIEIGGAPRPDKLSLVVFSGDFDRVHYALVMASAAAASNTPATLFFTQWATRALCRPDAKGKPGWHGLSVSQGSKDAAKLDAEYADRGVATFEELLAACITLDIRFMVCEMGLRAMGLTRADLREDVPVTQGGVVSFLADASATGAIVMV